MIVAIDFGITNTDIAISNDDALDFFTFKTNLPIEESNISELLNRIQINHKSIKTIGISGGKSSDLSEDINGIKLIKNFLFYICKSKILLLLQYENLFDHYLFFL